MSISLTIGGLPICGAVGNGAQMTIETGDCWAAHHKWVTGLAEKDAPLCVLRSTAKWAVNGREINEPRALFITITDLYLLS